MTEADNQTLPAFLKPYFWSSDLAALSLSAHREIIITTILSLGDRQAIDWLRSVYSQPEIKVMVERPIPGAFYGNKKSHNFWALLFGVPVVGTLRKIR